MSEFEMFEKHFHKYLLLVVVLLLAIGTTFYHFVESWSWIDSYYFSVVSLATVGYGDLSPQTDIGKIFTTFYILSGVGVVTAYFSFRVTQLRSRREKKDEEKRKK